jgi:hypothetical protein
MVEVSSDLSNPAIAAPSTRTASVPVTRESISAVVQPSPGSR